MSPESKALIRVWLFCLVFLPLTIALGFWQLDRADEKRKLADNMAALANLEPVFIDSGQPLGTGYQGAMDFRPYQVAGQYKGEYFLLDNRTREGRPGYEILQPFSTSSGHYLLVNRGWVASPRLRSELPDIVTPTQPTTISGYFYRSEGEPPVYGEHRAEKLQGEWPRRIQSISWPLISQELPDFALVQREFRLHSSDSPGALSLGWHSKQMSPEKHLGYAVQWFGLSVALLVLTVVYTWWSQRRESESKSGGSAV